jgi:hypothetical protein
MASVVQPEIARQQPVPPGRVEWLIAADYWQVISIGCSNPSAVAWFEGPDGGALGIPSLTTPSETEPPLAYRLDRK